MGQYDVVVVGAGAAGLMCAITAGQRGRSVLVLDHANKVGKKILMSGGGRCNFTNLFVEPDHYTSRNRHFCKSALSGYTQYDFIQMVESHGIPYQEKKLGQLFCEGRSKDILNMLLAECRMANVVIKTQFTIEHVQSVQNGFVLQGETERFQCQSLVVATGGLSIPTMGATGFGYKLARQFGMQVTDVRPALVPLTFDKRWLERTAPLAGVSCEAEVSTARKTFREDLLFTHRGLSGPVILQASMYWRETETISINLLPQVSVAELLDREKSLRSRRKLKNTLSQLLPKSLIENRLPELLRDKPVVQINREEQAQLDSILHHWVLKPQGSEGYRTAEVTEGGVDTDEVSSRTMESRRIKGLYFVGEVLDVTGELGGFNFQWAWASGYAAGKYV